MSPIAEYRDENSAPQSPLPLLMKLQRPMRSPLNHLFSKLDRTRVLSHSSQDISSSPFTSFVALLWMHSRTLTSFFNCGVQFTGLHTPQYGNAISTAIANSFRMCYVSFTLYGPLQRGKHGVKMHWLPAHFQV